MSAEPTARDSVSRARVPARAITWSVVALLAFWALKVNPPIERKPGEVLVGADTAVTHITVAVDTLNQGETVSELLERQGLNTADAAGAIQASTLDERRMPAGMAVRFLSDTSDSTPSEIVFRLAIDRLVHVKRTDSGWVASEERLPWTTDTIRIAGSINSNLYAAMDAAAPALPRATREDLTVKLADIYEYRVDMSRDLQVGDQFTVLAQRSVGPGGVTRIDKVLAATMILSGDTAGAFRYADGTGSEHYYDQNGKSLQAAFLRAPVEFKRISSTFGLRFHPILAVWRQHKGTDYAAAIGTPVRAIGDGVVAFAGVKHGYGNVIDIRHRNGYVSRYGHLRGFASGIHTGSRVNIGQTIAYVGMSGLATGPHLHFEILIDGSQVDSRVALARVKGGEPLPASQRAMFLGTRDRLLSALDGVSTEHLASRE